MVRLESNVAPRILSLAYESVDGFSIWINDNSKVAYFLLGHPVDYRVTLKIGPPTDLSTTRVKSY